VIRLPRPYAQVYQWLLQPSLYPAEVTDRERTRPLKLGELPPALVALSRAWGYVCERICRQVTRRLLGLPSDVASDPSDVATGAASLSARSSSKASAGPSSVDRVTDRLNGLLRISFSGSAHAHHAHFDASYTTFLGPGNVAGCLQFAEPPDAAGERAASATAQGGFAETLIETFIPSERLLECAGSDGLDGASFFLFTGVKHGGIHDACSPLRHRVVPPSWSDDDRGLHDFEARSAGHAQPAASARSEDAPTPPADAPEQDLSTRDASTRADAPERINVIYFLNSYSAASGGEEASVRAPDARSEAAFELNTFGQATVVHQSQFLCWPPLSLVQDHEDAADGEEVVIEGSSFAEMVDDWDEDQAIDWSGEGL